MRTNIPRRRFGWVLAVAAAAWPASPRDAAADEAFAKNIRPFLETHCIKCHGPRKKAGDVRLDDLTADVTHTAERWAAVRDQIRDGLMPPAKEARPDPAQIRAVANWVTLKTGARPARLPNQGNLIPHELLFGSAAAEPGATPARLWRLDPDGYVAYVQGLFGRGGGAKGGRSKSGDGGFPIPGLTQPFTLVDERGIRNYSGLYGLDEPTAEVLLRNSAAIVEVQMGLGGKKNVGPNPISEFAALVKAGKPSVRQLEAAVQKQHLLAVGRTASDEDVKRYLALYDKAAQGGDTVGAAKTMLQAVLLRTEAVYRYELGAGAADGSGRRMLAPRELAAALSLALGHGRDKGLFEAAAAGKLANREQVNAQVKRMLDDPSADTARIREFFRQYFEYDKATEVFKDPPKDFVFEAAALVRDTDRLVGRILAEDKDVFRRLLTTDASFVNYGTKKDGMPGPAIVKKAGKEVRKPLETIYGFDEWPKDQPVTLPADTRIGILMQPSWLVAWSTNFDNDPVRRGRWIRERLLGGTVPELPIGVAAQVPDDPHRTFRDRLTVTREARCWKCHQKMDDLGLPFEQFDHFGRFRTAEEVVDREAPAKPVAKKGKPAGPVTRRAPLDTTGLVADSGDPGLDGPVKDPRELIRRIAGSDRARQVFVRHVFRFFLGRNETLSDARALQEADRAYVGSGGSFKALVVSILSSDPFLYRATSPTGGDK